jgi:glutathione S-transferase
MPELIVHHYPMSPFAEKLRLALGYKGLAWKSVFIPAVMPKPDVVALTGGYRRTPLLQIGADIYCDTALIFNVLDHLQPDPPLHPARGGGLARTVAQWADSTLFWASMAYSLGPQGVAEAFGKAPPDVARAFGEDRKAMSTGMTRLRPGDGLSAYRSYLRRLSDMLEGQPYLLGDAPCVADFAAYHPLWFTRTQVPSLARILEATPAVIAWHDRMQGIGHGSATRLSSAEAIATAAAAQPAQIDGATFQDDHGIALGSTVTLAAESFGTETTEGELIAATRTQYTLRRVDERAGTVHVHFPRIGYVLRKV